MAAVLSTPPATSPTAASSRRNTWRDSFRLKLYGLVCIATILLIALQIYGVVKTHEDALDSKRDEISSMADAAVGILATYDKLVKDGTLDMAEAQKQAFRAVRGMRYGDNKNYMIAWKVENGATLVHATPEQESRMMFSSVVDSRPREAIVAENVNDMRANGGRRLYQVMQKRPGTTEPVGRQNVGVIYEPWGVVIGTGVWLDGVEAEFRRDIIASVVLSAISALVLLGLGLVVVRSVMRQLGGEPAGAVRVMAQAANGDFTTSTSGKKIPGSLLSAFGDMSGSIRSMIVNVRDEAGSLKRDAERLSESVGQVSSAASHQSEATSSMAAAIEELTVSVSHISEAAIETEKLSEGVASLCRNSEDQVNSASSGMQRIASAVGEASTKIAGLEARAEQINVIAAAIKEIASQTNLLALNAAIEAARAGEQGRGFSVVADEVRKLAERTASATIEIEQMVHAVQAETKESTATMSRVRPIVEEGTSLTHQVAESLREIRSRADMTLERVREVANATREQSSASTSIAQRVEGIAQMVEQTNASMEETARSASDMRDMSVRLDTLVGAFKV
ncbi:methyl-accepting chemotaxis protein [Pigmentiphaga aceris]|uniref:Methyl-accepting chemotaxis protein n=1 Tax=Pigmentiphaga aceris TaxID=1940612 RepID=A0A5C0AVC8_9BURK|nr:methyl-accepting chemotaxis protein [Pigmentiphaga aceris]QEI04621.1 methyl-accepting chemotaxis protein [Pigmentiphaga aceris]